MTKTLNRILIITLILLSITTIVAKENRFDSLITKGITHIYNIEFDKAELIFNKIKIEYPQRPAGIFFNAMTLWWKILLDLTNEGYDEQFYDMIENVVDKCDEIIDEDEKNLDAYFFKGGALGFRARLLAIREDWLDAALDGKEALPLIFEAYDLDSTNVDVQLGFGIYNYYAAVIPEHFEFVKPLMIFFPEGDKEKGIEQLKFVSENGKFSKIEATYFLMTSYYSFEKNYVLAHKYVDKLISQFPRNPVFQRYKGRIFVRQGNYSAASTIYFDILDRCSKKQNGYNKLFERESYYYIGGYYNTNNILDSAIVYYQKCEDLSKKIDVEEESGYLINSALVIAKTYEKLNDTTNAKIKFEEVLDYRDYRNSQEVAEFHLEKLEEKSNSN